MCTRKPSIRDIATAIKENDCETIRQFGVDSLDTFSDKQRKEHWISYAMERSSSTETLQALIDAGVDPLALPQGDGFSPLLRAISTRNLDYVDFLLNAGVDPNHELEAQRYTLAAVNKGDPQTEIAILERLVAKGVNLNVGFPWFGNEEMRLTVLDVAEDESVKEYLRSVGAVSANDAGAQPGKASRGDALLDEVIQFMQSEFGTVDERSFTDLLRADSGVTVHTIPPRGDNGCWTLFTTGLSRTPMNVPPELRGHEHCELYIQLPADWKVQGESSKDTWPIQLLSDLAMLPLENDAFFSIPVTVISNGEPPERLHSSVGFKATALLAGKIFERSDGRTVDVLCVMPIYLEEADLARRSIPDFLNALDQSGTTKVLDVHRASCVS
ncbi:Suppressor of fused protein (SUFU) [Roseimaritima ulvae]|uniref:Suppressor of fused protein (SUFU) n=1 Tax=Roseimaritima ulvae TaxID=980254 RepID=A0A5B9QZE9_9BACT|nr:Suppressor of fused protein (SUFU) [Roseimaritima ulvae]